MKLMPLSVVLLAAIISESVTYASPSAQSIALTIQGHWEKQEFNACETYILALAKDNPSYLPANIALATYYSTFNTDIEKVTRYYHSLLKQYRNIQKPEWDEFTQLLETVVKEWDLIEDTWLNKKKLTPAAIKSERNPAAIRRVQSWWPHLYLIEATPEVYLENESVEQAGPGYPPQSVGSPDP